ncbi:uncharacterized protein PgNI_08082 [Pyricularia grisea]|uniref:Uncharacterized protein n=1 Tax=Pyricularia grisea TaxID=148305 RepID=A0A6P8AW65_PYRGI|nr:uncharacterized protein PgNI_08082 [Pyricularia grisea]TLD06432.1 hypothetical protein PgNI_08082 [Pyricularia grisea]
MHHFADKDNEYRRIRVGELLADFRDLQTWIAEAPDTPDDMDDYYSEGWAALRQCALDGHHILNCGADTSVPQVRGGQEEQEKAELLQNHLDAFSRRHESHKIWLRQGAAQRWVAARFQILQGRRPHARHSAQLKACDRALRREYETITDEAVYNQLQASDIELGRWTGEDPSLRAVQRWLRSRRRA